MTQSDRYGHIIGEEDKRDPGNLEGQLALVQSQLIALKKTPVPASDEHWADRQLEQEELEEQVEILKNLIEEGKS